MIKHERTTKCSSNKGFSGNTSILPRSNFGGGGQESATQSLTAVTLKRYGQPFGHPKSGRFDFQIDTTLLFFHD